MKTAMILGVGPENGLGAALAKRYASMGYHVLIVGRSLHKLEPLVELIEQQGGMASAFVADASDEQQVEDLFFHSQAKGRLDVAIYNAGNNVPGRLIDMPTETFVDSWKVCCLGGFFFSRQAMKQMLPHQQGTILFTGASASLRGKAGFAAFNSAKSALRILAQALAKEAGPEGIHVGHLIIDGVINGEKAELNFPDYVKKLGPQGLLDLERLVDAYVFLSEQEASAWTFELDLRTAQEQW